MSFDRFRNGCGPWAGVTADAQGNLYGTAPWNGPYGGGVVYKLAAR
ncbi:MAG TPA: hypothetical protein VMI94_24535 [Bryobacteraceae bacterium]|nr:hypothetical protein [Bryobacteraceae bacterium]